MTDTDHDTPHPPRAYQRTRVPYIAAEIRGGVLRPAADVLGVNTAQEHGFTIRMDEAPHGLAPLRMPVWLRVDLNDDERRQWAQVLLEGL
jgi:hypothetical protein